MSLSTRPILSVSLAAYDGYELPTALESLARMGVRHAEPDFDDSAAHEASRLSAAHARRVGISFRQAGVQCASVSSQLDFASTSAAAILQRQLDFVATIGAHTLVLPGPHPGHRKRAIEVLSAVASSVEGQGLRIALSPAPELGDTTLPDTLDLISAAQLPWLGLDFRTAAVALAQPGLGLADQFSVAQSQCSHVHLGDVREADGWFPVALGDGGLACQQVLSQIRKRPLSITVDLPLRNHRTRHGERRRAPYRLPITDIEQAVSKSLGWMSRQCPTTLF